MLLAAVLLVLGIVTRGLVLRWASMVLMLLAIIKVFAYDTRHLSDLLRVASFLCLGLSLMALGFVYQRYVFRAAAPAAGEPAT